MVPTRALTITVSEGLYGRFVEMARKQGMTPAVYGKLLFEAAYSARCGMTGDRELDAAVAAIGTGRSGGTDWEAEARSLHSQLQAAGRRAEHAQAAQDEAERRLKETEVLMEAALREAERLRVEDHQGARDRKLEADLMTVQARLHEADRLATERYEQINEQALTIVGLRMKLAATKDALEAVNDKLAAQNATVAELEQRIAAATMLPAKAVSAKPSPAPALTPDQVKRAMTHRRYGLSIKDIAMVMKVDPASVKAALRSAA